MLATQTPSARDGRGRARTGPSASRATLWSLFVVGVLAVALGGSFALGTAALRAVSPEVLGVVAGLASAVGLLVGAGSPRRVASIDTSGATASFALGALALTAAPYAVFANRYSDAPPGSEVLWLTTAGWAALLTTALLITRRGIARRLALGAAGLLGLVGSAAIVANWERPSSFSPFVRYVGEEAWILGAGLAVAALWWWLDRERSRKRLGAAALAAAAGGVAAALALGFSRASSLGLTAAAADGGVLLFALMTALGAAAAVGVLKSAGVGAVAGGMMLPAAGLTLLTYVEQATGAFGPQPILLGPAAGGALVALTGAVLARAAAAQGSSPLVAAEDDGAATPLGRSASRLPWAACSLAGVALLAGLVSLWLPALEGHAKGLRWTGDTVDIRFALMGFEAVGPWLAVAVSLGALALTLDAVRRHSDTRDRADSLVLGVLLIAAGATWPLVWSTPLRTLTSFVPSDVQVDFGSEFASITFTPLSTPLAILALGGALASLALLLAHGARGAQETATGEPVEGDGS